MSRRGKKDRYRDDSSSPVREPESAPIDLSVWKDVPTLDTKNRKQKTIKGGGGNPDGNDNTSSGKGARKGGKFSGGSAAGGRGAGAGKYSAGAGESAEDVNLDAFTAATLSAADAAAGVVKSSADDGGFHTVSRGRGLLPMLTSFESTAVSYTGTKASGGTTIRTVFAKDDAEGIKERRLAATKPLIRCTPNARGVYPPRLTGAPASPNFYATAALPIPSRPPWSVTMTAAQLHAQEAEYFRMYLTRLYTEYGADRLNHFEHNLNVWRQLWRTAEKSHILILVADARHPLLHFNPGLYSYITQDLKKPLLLLLNKIDLVPLAVLRAWQKWFAAKYPLLHVVLFSSYPSAAHRIALASEASAAAAAASAAAHGTPAPAPAAVAHAHHDADAARSLSASELAVIESALLATTDSDLAAHARQVGRMKRSPLLDPVGVDALLEACRGLIRERGAGIVNIATGAIAPAAAPAAAAKAAAAASGKQQQAATKGGDARRLSTTSSAGSGDFAAEELEADAVAATVNFTASRLLSGRETVSRAQVQEKREQELAELRARLKAQAAYLQSKAAGKATKTADDGDDDEDEDAEDAVGVAGQAKPKAKAAEGLFGAAVEDAAALEGGSGSENEDDEAGDDDDAAAALSALSLNSNSNKKKNKKDKRGQRGAHRSGSGGGEVGRARAYVGDDVARVLAGEVGGNRRTRNRLAGLAAILNAGKKGAGDNSDSDYDSSKGGKGGKGKGAKSAKGGKGKHNDSDDDDDHENTEDEDEDEDDSGSEGSVDEEAAAEAAKAAAEAMGVMLTIGTVGHPNAGKSSLINALTGKKVLSVSRQPGHTKIVQPLKINATTVLCDCPGLIFPAVDIPRPLQVLAGLFPIPHTREYVAAVHYLSERIPLEDVLGIKPPADGETGTQAHMSGAHGHKAAAAKKGADGKIGADADAAEEEEEEDGGSEGSPRYPWSAYAICEQYAVKRGFTLASGRLDINRAAQAILYAVADGHIPFYFAPPAEDIKVPTVVKPIV